MNLLNRHGASELALFVLRLVLGVIFLAHGAMKFAHMTDTVAAFTHIGVPLPGFAALAIALLEVIGGIGLMLGIGWGTRVLALLLAVDMACAILLAKRTAGFVNGYEFELLLLAALLAIVLSGPGRLALLRESDASLPVSHGQVH